MSGLGVRLHYEGYSGCASVCDVLIEHGTDTTLVTVAERDDNPGESITNCAKTIATTVVTAMREPDLSSIRFVEHYGPRSHRDVAYAEVTFDWKDRTASRPRWRNLGSDGYRGLRAELGLTCP